MTDDSSSGGSSALLWAVIGVLAVTIAGFGLAEWMQAQDEMAQVAAAGGRVQQRVRELETVAGRLPALAEEAERVRAARAELLRVVPASLDLPGLRQAIETAAAHERLAVLGFREKVERVSGSEYAQLTVTLGGPQRAVERLRHAAIPRVLRWSDARPAGSAFEDRKSTRLNSSHIQKSRMPSSA